VCLESGVSGTDIPDSETPLADALTVVWVKANSGEIEKGRLKTEAHETKLKRWWNLGLK